MKPYYEHGGMTIYHGDCREIIAGLRFDAVLTDPPYGVNGGQNTRTATERGFRKNDYTLFSDSQDYVESVAVPVVRMLVDSGCRVVLTPGNRCVTLYPAPDSFGAVYQPASVGLQPWGRADAQPILYYGRSPYGGTALPGQRCSYVVTEAADTNGHPCPKPLGFWSQLVDAISLSGETVLDPFMGSGTTMVAAKNLGRKAIGIEIEERYCEIAAKRLAQEVLPLANHGSSLAAKADATQRALAFDNESPDAADHGDTT
jgi:site-specific DNA-methyltransferase (adenine-specific)